jgi:hypothetical protein
MTNTSTTETAETPLAAASSVPIVLEPRQSVALLAAVGAMATAACTFASDSEAGWIARVAGAIVLLAVIPGALTVLAWRPRRVIGLLELLGFSIAISFVELQFLTISALTAHWSPLQALMVIGLMSAAHVVWVARSLKDGVRVQIARHEIALVLLLVGLALLLYAAGSPLANREDHIHISIARRLAELSSPAIDNFYLSPGVVYPYPFPGTHYMMALISRVGDIDPMFLYHKLRAFWGVAAIVLLYGCARVVFESARMALAAALTAVAFVANGTFAGVPRYYWAQMAPYSHASDVAMGVLLPALLFLSFAYLRAETQRESRFFLVSTIAMAVTLIMVHAREVVQFLVYFTAFAATLVIVRGWRTLLGRTMVLLGVTIAALVAHRVWYLAVVTDVDSLVSGKREDVRNLFMESSWGELFGLPLPLLDNYMPGFPLWFQWWIPVVLVLSPVLLYVLRHRPLAWFFAAGTATYLLILRLPVLALPFTYATYFEILYTPARNVVFFVHVLAGVGLYVIAAWMARRGYVVLCVLTPAIAWVAIEFFRRFGAEAAARPDTLFVPVLIGYAAVLVSLLRRRAAEDSRQWIDEPRPRWAAAFSLLLLPMVIVTWEPESAVASWSWSNPRSTPAALLTSLECREDGQFCPPPASLIRFVREQVPVEAILAADYREVYEPTLFMPQQVTVWSGAIEGLAEPRRVFPAYFRHLDRVTAASLDQPFFNDRETREQRVAFVRDLQATNVLVNPRLYSLMKEVLAGDDDLFSPRYDDGTWALYEVTLR